MNRVIALSLLCLLTVLSLSVDAGASDWPQWRGPFLNGSSDEKNLPEITGVTENLRWSIDLPGEAGSTPIISGDRIFLTSTNKDNPEVYAMCIDRNSGKTLWQKTVNAEGRKASQGTSASPSPATDGKRVFFLYGSGDFLAVDFEGKVLWQRNLENDFGPLCLKFIYGASPLLYKDRLYIQVLRQNPDQPGFVHPKSLEPVDSFVLCVDAASGKDIWKQNRPTTSPPMENRDSYSTPMISNINGKPQILVMGANFLTANDLKTGAEIWRMRYSNDDEEKQRTVATPLTMDDLIIASRPLNGGVFAVRPDFTGEADYSKKIWEYKDYAPDAPSPVAYNGRLYFVHDPKKFLTCLDPKNGKEIWASALGCKKTIHSSPVAADGKIYCLSIEGELTVVKADDSFQVLSRASLGGEPCRSSVAIARGSVFVRTAEKLFCFGGGK